MCHPSTICISSKSSYICLDSKNTGMGWNDRASEDYQALRQRLYEVSLSTTRLSKPPYWVHFTVSVVWKRLDDSVKGFSSESSLYFYNESLLLIKTQPFTRQTLPLDRFENETNWFSTSKTPYLYMCSLNDKFGPLSYCNYFSSLCRKDCFCL